MCDLEVDEAQAKAGGLISDYQGKTYYFCRYDCNKQFDKDPERYVAKATGAPGMHTGPAAARDPVSNLEVDVGYAATLGLKREYEGKTYFFRHYSSLEQFDKDPKEYVNKPAAALPAESPLPSAGLKQPGQGEEHDRAKSSGPVGKADLPETLKETPVTDKDPVCGMNLGEEVVRSLAYKTVFQGKIYYFCSDECKREFDRNPEHYASKAASGAVAATNPAPSPTPGLDLSKPTLSPLLRRR